MTVAIIWGSIILIAIIGGIIASSKQKMKKFCVSGNDLLFIKNNKQIEHDLFVRHKVGKQITESEEFFKVCDQFGNFVICQPVRFNLNTGVLTFKVATNAQNQPINRD